MAAVPLSVQLYSVRDQLAADRDATLRRIAEIGYDAVEPFNPGADPKGFRQLVDGLGLTVSSTHASQLLDPSVSIGSVLDDIAVLGTDLAIVPGGIPHEDFTTHDGLRRTADLLNGIAEQTEKHGIRLGYHNHWWELESTIDGRHALEILAELVAPEVFLQVDTYWAAVGGADPAALLTRLGDRVLALHVKDGPVRRGEPHTGVGTGVMPVREILAAAPDALRIVELDECAGDIFDALATSRTYLAELGTE